MDPKAVLRQSLLGVSRNKAVRTTITQAPVSRSVVARFVPGETTDHAVSACSQLGSDGLLGTIDFLGEDTLDLQQAQATRDAYLTLLAELAESGLTENGRFEVSVKLSAIGQFLGADGDRIALDHARVICEAAQLAGTTVTIDMEDHTTTDRTLESVRELRTDYPWVGAVLQAYLKRTEADCRDLATEGSRVRLCKGAYDEPASVAFQDKAEVDLSYVRCLKVLMEGDGYPMVASHDPRIIAIAGSLATRTLRTPDTFEYQMLYGIRPKEQRRLAATGAQMRVYVPYGDEWYGYLMRRMAERPANTAFFLRGLATRG
ncbi:proline dehydrogenase [Calidifontibacter sp. DB0510]|uniref:proline dehydrogenase n=1 Tax=Metallococcus carri TaxID=1656884 RepID=A0A967B629_9MICO|nr:proline dehydrogenase family protein [Metallococcus carri]NHN55331.1 proline dehydrogenase [Metallococcus carri]NOP36408.1 proline dehydrogenase [Calidifontibacter sp. DB2511S]